MGSIRFTKERYQQGSLRKVRRKKGFVWEFRYYMMNGSKRVLKQVTIDGEEYPTEKKARQHVAPLLHRVNEGSDYAALQQFTFGQLLKRYEVEELPTRKSTRDSYQSLIRTHLRPQWEDTPLAEMKAGRIREWISGLPLSNFTKGHIRSLMHKLLDLAMLWEWMDIERNPVELVKMKGITKREKQIQVLGPGQYREIVKLLPRPFDVMVQVVATLGLRLSEMLGLKWEDISWKEKTITIQRSAYRGSIDETKTEASRAVLPLANGLLQVLKKWRKEADQDFPWVFANPATGQPYLGPSIQQRWIRPAGEKIGIKGVGFHTFRHSYKSWLDSVGAPMGAMKDLMRHSNISVTMNVYGDTLTPEKRRHNDAVARLLYLNQRPKQRRRRPATARSLTS